MKTSTVISSFFIFTSCALVLSSCSSSVEIVKRKHTDGYYVHINKPVKPSDKADSHAFTALADASDNFKEISSADVSFISENTPVVENLFTESEIKVPAIVSKKQFQNLRIFSKTFSEEKVMYNTPSQLQPAKKFKQFSQETPSVKRVDDIVLIILCILLPPLAVYLKDGIGTPFWIDLILTFLFIIPGVIYAFIVCFA